MEPPNSSFSQINKRGTSTFKLEKGKAYCNYFPLAINKEIENIYVFSMEMTPHIPMEKLSLRTRILSLLENDLSKIIGKYTVI